MLNRDALIDGLYLFNQSPQHRLYTLAEFNSYLIFPLLSGKLRLFYQDARPVSLVTWCWLTSEEARQFLSEDFVPQEREYARDTGDQLWGVEFIAPYGHARQTMRNMRRVCADLYGNDVAVHWRRLKSPDKLIKRTF